MKISKNINTCILTDNNLDIIKLFPDIKVINKLNDLKTISEDIVIFDDIIRNLKSKDKLILLKKMKKANQHFINITSDIEDVLLADYLVVYSKNRLIIEGNIASVLKEEKILKRLGFGLPFISDLSLQLNYYDLLNKMYFDERKMVDDLW